MPKIGTLQGIVKGKDISTIAKTSELSLIANQSTSSSASNIFTFMKDNLYAVGQNTYGILRALKGKGGVGKDVADQISFFKNPFAWIGRFSEKLLKGPLRIISTVLTGLGKVAKSVIEIPFKVANAVTGGIKAAIDGVTKILPKVLTSIANVAGSIFEGLSKLTVHLTNGAVRLGSVLIDTTAKLASGLGKFLGTIIGPMLKMGAQLTTSFMHGLMPAIKVLSGLLGDSIIGLSKFARVLGSKLMSAAMSTLEFGSAALSRLFNKGTDGQVS